MIKNIINVAMRCIAPAYCPACYRFIADEAAVFCSACDNSIIAPAPFDLKVTDTWTIPTYAAYSYKEPLKSLILAKAHSNRAASFQLAHLIWRKTIMPNLMFDYLVPIPLHWTRFAWRGYNQAEVMAYYLSKLSNKPMLHVLKRTRRTQFQSTLKPDERDKNVQNVFIFNDRYADLIAGKRILIVDDLLTTGATLKSAAKVIAKMKPAVINAIVAARVI